MRLRSRDWVPRSVRRNAREVAQAMETAGQELGRNATETEVAERLGIPVAGIVRCCSIPTAAKLSLLH